MRRNFTKSISFFVFLLLSWASSAQIIYTNIEDVTLECLDAGCYQSYNLDINNDNVDDYILYASAPADFYRYHYKTGIQVNNQNETISNTRTFFPEPYPLKKNFNIGNVIVSNYPLSWGWEGVLSEQYYYCCVYGPCPKDLCHIYKNGSWTQSGDHFLGLKINVNGQVYYGWARLSVKVTNRVASLTIKDYAYESTPGTAILAGNTGSSAMVKASNENLSEENSTAIGPRVFPNPVGANGKIEFTI